MKKSTYQQFFKDKRWQDLAVKVCGKLKAESVLITALPEGGSSLFLKYTEEVYEKISGDSKTLIISFDIVTDRTRISHLCEKIVGLINYKLNFPNYLKDLNTEETLREIVNRGKRILIIVNLFERLQKFPASMSFLVTLRYIDPLNIRFLSACDISCLTKQNLYTPARVLTSSNVYILPKFDVKGLRRSFEVFKKVYGWQISPSFISEIFALSGGLPGLFKYIAKYIHENHPRLLDSKRLLQDPAINYKVKNIIEALEQNGLIKDSKLDLSKTDLLQKLGVIDNKNKLRIKLLKPFLKKGRKRAKVPDLDKLLSVQERTLYQLFKTSTEKIFTLDNLSKQLWGEKADEKYSPWAVYKVISNLNRKLRKMGLKLKNYRGRGYSLTSAGVKTPI